MTAKFERDAGLAQAVGVLDRGPRVGEDDGGAAAHEQFGGGDAAAGGADDHHLLATNGERSRAHRSFKVVRLKRAKMIEAIRKRVMTFGSLQPISSK